MPDNVKLEVAGGVFGGWTSVRVSLGIEQIAGAFELQLTERWPGQDTARPIVAGEQCTVSVNDEVVITGYVDDVVVYFDGNDARISVTGRDATGDLVDCAAEHKSGEWSGVGIEQIARDLTAPFGVTVKVETDLGGPMTHAFALQTSETVFEAMERAARMRGVLLVSDGQGSLVLTRASTVRIEAALVEGENLLRGEHFRSLRDRFSTYIVKATSPGSDLDSGSAVSEVQATVNDAGVPRYRPMIVLAEENADAAAAAKRANWEKNVRLGRAVRVTTTVQGWAHADGVWQTNRLVSMRAPSIKVDAELLIAAVEFIQSNEEGTITHLVLTRPEAFEIEPLEETDPDGGGL